MPATKGGIYGGVSAAMRQDDRRRRLLTAGLEVIGTKSWSSATVRAICAEAGLSSRFFYESFASVEELAAALFDDIFERTTATVAAAVTASPPDPRVRNRVAIETFVGSLTDDRRVARFVFMESLGSAELTRRRMAMIRTAAETVLDQIGTHGPTGVSRRYRELVAMVLVGGLAEVLIAWIHGDVEQDLGEIVDDYVKLVLDVGDATYGKAKARRTTATS